MSFIFRSVRPADIQNWIKTNASGSLRPTARESWRAYLAANSGTGQTLQELETSFLAALGKTGFTQHDRWGKQLSGSGKVKEQAKSTYK